jgi:hypothetical protein
MSAERGTAAVKRSHKAQASAIEVAETQVIAACTKAEDGRKMVEIGDEWICIRRRIAGMDTWVNIPTASYRGVTLRAAGDQLFEIVIMHMDASLEIVLTRTSDDTDIIALWRSYAAMLRLPLLIEDQDGRLQPVDASLPRLSVERRLGSPLKNRRPRFLATRKVGIAIGEMILA